METFTYLGTVFDETASDTPDIEARIRKGSAAVRRIGKVLWCRNTPRSLKVKILMVFVYPTATYACETWAMTAADERKLDVWWMKLLRRIKGVRLTDRVRSSEILRELRTSKLTDLIKERMLRYCGHMWRYPNTRWANFAARAKITGQTKGGRSHAQYNKAVAKLLKKHELTTDHMKDDNGSGDAWREKLLKIFPKGDNREHKEINRSPNLSANENIA